MARAFEQLPLGEIRGPDVLEAAPGLNLADVRLHLVPHGLAVGQEEGDAGAHVVREGEQAQLPPQPPMVARPRLLKALEVRVELRLRREQRPVDALQLRLRLVAAPVGPRHRRQPEGPDLPRRGHVPAAAEVAELGVRAQPQRVAAGAELVDQFQLERLRREALPRLRDRHFIPDEAVVALDLPAHLTLDLGQIVGRERPRQQEVVVEARVDRRADRDLPARGSAAARPAPARAPPNDACGAATRPRPRRPCPAQRPASRSPPRATGRRPRAGRAGRPDRASCRLSAAGVARAGRPAAGATGRRGIAGAGEGHLVGDTGLEPVTSAMSTQRSSQLS